MLSKTLLSTVFVVHALASPLLNKRAYTVEDVTVTVMTTVTAGYEAAATSAAPSSTSSAASQDNYAQWTWGYHERHSYSKSTSIASTSTYVAPVESSTATVDQSSYTAALSTYVAPSSSEIPPPSSYVTPSSTNVAPSSSDVPPSSSYVAPSSTDVAPSPSSVPSTSAYVAPTSASSTPASSSSAYSSAPSGDAASGTNIDASNFDTTLTPAIAPDLTDASDPKYTALALQHHNAHRANHSVPMVQWDADLAGAAKMLAVNCPSVEYHDTTLAYGSVKGNTYGQNNAGGRTIGEIGISITEAWYNGEMENYAAAGFGNANPPSGDLDSWGHFSQVVWRETTHIGCWTQTCPHGIMDFTVCNYSPPGNFMIGNNDGPGAVQNYTSVLPPKGNAKWAVIQDKTTVG